MVFGRSPPEHLSRTLMLRILTYRVQAEALGDLDTGTLRALSRLHQTGGAETIPLPELRSTKPGTLLEPFRKEVESRESVVIPWAPESGRGASCGSRSID